MSKKKPPSPSSSIADLIASINRPLYDWQAIRSGLEESHRQLAETVRVLARMPDLSATLEENHRQMVKSIRTVTQAPNLRVEYARIAADLQAHKQAMLQIPSTTEFYESCLKSITRAPAVSFDFKTMDLMQGNYLRDLLQALTGAAVLNPSVERPALPSPQRENPSPACAASTSAPVTKRGRVRSRLTVFLAALPAFFEPPEHPIPKFRLH